jgi:ribonuclease D
LNLAASSPPIADAIAPEALALLPIRRYEGRIELVSTPEAISEAMADIRSTHVVGFDTETRPSFRQGESYLPSLVQVATSKAVYLFLLDRVDCRAALAELLAAPAIVKAGIGLAHDLRQLGERHPAEPAAVVDLGRVARRHGIKQTGLRNLAALFMAIRIPKGARTTNWAAPRLTPAQIGYAATDAWASRELYLCFEEQGLLTNHPDSPNLHSTDHPRRPI